MNAVIQTINERRSVREFSDKDISREILESIVLSGVHAPTGRNMQTWQFTVVDKSEDIDFFKNKVKTVLETNETDSLHGFINPKALIIVSNRKNNYNNMADGACAMENMMLAAYSLGIGSCWNNSLRTCQDDDIIRRELLNPWGVPENHMIVGTLLLGYPKDTFETVKKTKRRENVIHYVSDY